jgi:hypothetical protein
MNFLSQIIVKFRDLIKPNEESRFHPEAAKDDQQHVMSDDEKLDQALEESFPASDPPGHISKSSEDRNLH